MPMPRMRVTNMRGLEIDEIARFAAHSEKPYRPRVRSRDVSRISRRRFLSLIPSAFSFCRLKDSSIHGNQLLKPFILLHGTHSLRANIIAEISTKVSPSEGGYLTPARRISLNLEYYVPGRMQC